MIIRNVIVPKYRAFGVSDWDQLYVKQVDGSESLNAATAAVINYLPIIGVPALTEETVDDAWRRIAIHEALFGALVVSQVGSCEVPGFVTRDDLVRHQGLETECIELSFLDYCARIQKRAISSESQETPAFVANASRSLLQICGV
jgi:hypothetical protein